MVYTMSSSSSLIQPSICFWKALDVIFVDTVATLQESLVLPYVARDRPVLGLFRPQMYIVASM
jgi:hypothetical protein